MFKYVHLAYFSTQQLTCCFAPESVDFYFFSDTPVSATKCQREIRVISKCDVDHNHQLHFATDHLQDVNAGTG